ncbi:APC family permease [Clostridium sp.]|uniref:APC family permease n=1 Tax=Clostridium sp. TaxID=1506 RepID=UPI0026385337|nr:APC family permease [Clostridium sp.]
MKKNEYGLFTSIGMIVGIVIGSGIFFKSDNILVATNGSILLGVLVFCIAALGIIFGSLTISELASRYSRAGGIITYAENSYNEKVACAFGWFHTFLYYPTLVAVISWVSGIYICILFGIEGGLSVQIGIGFGIMVFLYIVNVLSTRIGGYFQNVSTVIKIIPLILIAVIGIIFGDSETTINLNNTIKESNVWIFAIAPIAFSFDGWIISTSIAHEIKDSKKNLPKALISAPLFILLIYVLYFVGISKYIGPEKIISLGDAHVDLVAKSIFGPLGGKIIITFVVISIIGTVNGLIMGHIRMPYSLGIRGMLPKSKEISKVNKFTGISVNSAIIAFISSCVCLFIHYLTEKYSLIPNGDISEISITVNYMLYILLYYKVFRMGIDGEVKGLWRGKINPIFATIGSLIILFGSFNNPMFKYYLIVNCILLLGAYLFCKYKRQEI